MKLSLRLAILVSGTALIALLLATLAGFLAPLEPRFDLVNHFRLHLITAAAGLLVLCTLARAWPLARLAGVLLVFNMALAVPAFVLSAERADGAAASFKILTFNIGAVMPDNAKIEAMLRAQDADLVLLLEVEPPVTDMVARLRDIYPYESNCVESLSCRLVLLSKRPLRAARTVERRDKAPPYIDAHLELDGKIVQFYGVHMARPFARDWHRDEIDWVINRANATSSPLIVAGDFNATPWSWSLTRLQLQTGLERHRTLGANWPVRLRSLPVPFPQLLIDHILTRGDLRTVDAAIGPDLGSDHLPFILQLKVP